jgi:hypothetical protein
MSDEIYYYKDQVKELQAVNSFVRSNTINSILSKLEWLKEERDSKGLSNAGLDHAIELVRCMK